MSGSVICQEFHILVVLGIPNWQIEIDSVYIHLNVCSKALLF